MFTNSLLARAKPLLKYCEKHGIMIASAESCTGGLIAALFTEIAGSSAVFERGFVTYSNAAKHELLGIKPAIIKRHGAVSAQVARAMAEGALKHSKAALSVAVTGIAGPTGGSTEKPVGLVYIAVGRKKYMTQVEEFHFKGDRSAVRSAAVKAALMMIEESVRG